MSVSTHWGSALLVSSVAASALVVACAGNQSAAPFPSPPGVCDAAKAQFAVGSPASQELLDRARVAAQAATARFLRPNQIITMEYLASRLNLNLNDRDIVRSAHCG